MKNINTLTVKEYIIATFVAMALSIFCFKYIAYIYFLGLSDDQSLILNILFLCFNVIIGVIFTIKKRRNFVSIFVNVIISHEIYLVISYFNYYKLYVVIVLIITFLIVSIYCYLHFFQDSKPNMLRKIRLNIRTTIYLFLGIRTIFAFILLLLVVPICISGLLGLPTLKATESDSISTNQKEYKISQWEKELDKLEEKTWSKLTIREKLDLTQIIANIERTYLGIYTELPVVAKPLQYDVAGNYDDELQVITIDLRYLNEYPSKDVVRTICHEAYHAYQHRQVDVFSKLSKEEQDLLMFVNAREYKETFEGGYIELHEDFDGYYEQQVEVKARNYAEYAIHDYFDN